jgi:peptidyl-prolyl cis-trans isomerase NIMA-interacting 1
MLVGLLFLGCGGSQPSAEAPDDQAEESAPLGKAAQCLADAEAMREPKPDAPEVIDVSHILVRHRDLKEPHGATRTREEACLRALDALQALQANGDWNAVALEYTDAKNDVLGRVRADELTTEFANAAFALEPNELSYVVETSRGFHIILRKR